MDLSVVIHLVDLLMEDLRNKDVHWYVAQFGLKTVPKIKYTKSALVKTEEKTITAVMRTRLGRNKIVSKNYPRYHHVQVFMVTDRGKEELSMEFINNNPFYRRMPQFDLSKPGGIEEFERYLQ